MAQAKMTLAERKRLLEQRRPKVQAALNKRREQVTALEERLRKIDKRLVRVKAALKKQKKA